MRILAVIIYIGADILAGNLWHCYNFIFQSKGELAAINSPVRQIALPLDLIYYILIGIFGLGTWRLVSGGLFLKITAGMLIGYTVISLLGMFFPKHLGETQKSIANSMNTIFGAISLFLLLFAILFEAIAYKNWFRFYSLGILMAFIILTIFGLFIAPQDISKILYSTSWTARTYYGLRMPSMGSNAGC